MRLLLDGLPVSGALEGGLRRHAPSLATLLARGRALQAEASLSTAIARAFGLDRGLPIAPHTLAMDGLMPGDAYWLRADPVSLQFHQDQLVLLGPDRLAVRREEADALICALQRHFGDDGLAFHAPRPERWYLRVDAGDTLSDAAPLDAVVGRAVEHHLPRGAQAAVWRSRMNEIQMLLNAHPVNQAREAAGQWPINSVWFWGGGRHTPLPSPPFSHLAARHPLARALAGATGTPCTEPEGLHALHEREAAAMVIVELPLGGGADILAEELRRLEQAWFRPVLQALRRGGLRHLDLHCTGGGRPRRRELTPMSVYRFWLRPSD